MVVVFFGTPAFAVPTLEALLGSAHTVAAVVTQPDRPRGRGQKTTASPVKEAALAAGVPVLQPESVKTPEFAAELSALHADIGVVAAYGQILTQQLLDTPRLGMINVHASLLPRYRGAAPINRSIINGDTETGVTIMRMVRALDAGAMLAKHKVPIGPDQTSEELERVLAVDGAHLLTTVLDDVGRLPGEPQVEAAATYAPKITKADARVDWHWPSLRIHNLIRGLQPQPRVSVFAGGKRLILHRARVANSGTGSAPGTILEANGERIRVATGDGAIDLLQLQAEGGRPMSTKDFLAGNPLPPGTVLQTSA